MPASQTGAIFNIQRFSVHDGPGIRTCVFLKGCPLACVWCHNPESLAAKPEIGFYPDKCGGCGACATACPRDCHAVGVGHMYSRDNCDGCGACAATCLYGGLAVIGKTVTAGEVMETVMRDAAFYRHSGGGLTLSGGEPFYQPDFALGLLELAKQNGLHTCVETCGAVAFAVLERAVGFADIFLYDIKETSPQRHKTYTGASSKLIMDNLERLNALGARIILRCPVIPGYNDREDHFRRVGALAERLSGVTQVDIQPYHPLGVSKAEAIGKTAQCADIATPDKQTVEGWAAVVRTYTAKPVMV